MQEFLIVDGYNIINAWEETNRLKEESYEHARLKLLDVLHNYQGCSKINIIVVFDAHNNKGKKTAKEKYAGIEVVYTKEKETADMYIEKLVSELAARYRVVVATSDGIEQSIILQKGALRLSARELWNEINEVLRKNREFVEEKILRKKENLMQRLPADINSSLEKWRCGKYKRK